MIYYWLQRVKDFFFNPGYRTIYMIRKYEKVWENDNKIMLLTKYNENLNEKFLRLEGAVQFLLADRMKK